MEAKLWLVPILLTFASAGLVVNLFLIDTKEAPVADVVGNSRDSGEAVDFGVKRNLIPFPSTALEWFGGMIMGMVEEAESIGDTTVRSKSNKYHNIPFSPNPTTCHCPANGPSFGSAPAPTDFEFPDPSSPMRVRPPAHLVSEDYFANYSKAIAIMKQLPPDHPHSLKGQAEMHWIYWNGADNHVNSSNILKIQRSWFFFPWYRIFIYFHERIIGKLIGDDAFALPFWNWDSPDGMMIPDIYTKGSPSDTRIVDIDFNEVDSGLEPEEQISTNLGIMYLQMISSAKKPELFMGCRLRSGEEGDCDGPGSIESAPHNTLTRWLWRRFFSAGHDTLLYAHHANIDRLWTVWKKMNGNELEFADTEWLDSEFCFYDENSRLVRIKVRDCLDTTKLGYRYEDVDLPWLAARPEPSIPPRIAHDMLKTREAGNVLRMPGSAGELVDVGQTSWTLDKSVTARIHRPRRQRTKKETEEEEEVLVVYGIGVKRDTYVKFDVFVNIIDETMVSPRSREFAGSFSTGVRHGKRLVRDEGDAVTKSKSNLKLGISELLQDLEADGDEYIWVTLVPRGGTGLDATVDGVRIEYMRW
ncbi:polyphenol oxidase, chloroplastic-like [Phoenix dactylifera]|uniref:Polyphenol oxidase, chloroplastic-like n=1 Tax=Phoenix dactylifera TaxID=42345 RepID=A0A8B9AG70_PHODC|nr:polyphenol oxidase, chloroplastic-like [Phoenix dactylifera]XP_038982968.1 polyphenol oxidase, chloroplastic-like [Phoenix dactylifera]